MTIFYFGTSAAVKLIIEQPESAALMAWVKTNSDRLVSSDLLRTELLRTTKRGAPEQMGRARIILESLTLVTLPSTTFERAAELAPDLLRSLDSLHLAAALELGDELDGFVTYDELLAKAAHLHGIEVIAHSDR